MSQTRQTILIIDDSEFVRNYHTYILQQAQFDVITAIDGSDGLEKLYSHRCDVVMTDINMENMDGYEFIRRVRKDRQYGDLPIIIVSTDSEAKDKGKGFRAGANLYIVKPCTPEVMIENVRMILGVR